MLYTFHPSDTHMSESNTLPMVSYCGLDGPHNANIDIIAHYILYVLLMVLVFLLFCLDAIYIPYIC